MGRTDSHRATPGTGTSIALYLHEHVFDRVREQAIAGPRDAPSRGRRYTMSDFNKILDHETRERRVGTIVTGGLLGMIVFLVVSLVLVL